MFTTVGLIAKRGDNRVGETLARLLEQLARHCVEVLVDESAGDGTEGIEARRVPREKLGETCDLAIVLGGDGTFLNAARSLAGQDIRLLGVNLGRVGFLTDVLPEDLPRVIGPILEGDHGEEERFLLSTRVMRDGRCELDVAALNEVVAHSWRIARLLEFETYVDSRLVNRQRADGLIVSTPTGSTAYALSSGGPILHPAIDALVLVPVCPHTLTTRPLVVPGGSEVEIVLATGEQPEAQLTCDGQTTLQLQGGDVIRLAKHPDTVKLIHPNGYDYYSTLRGKLSWGKEH